MFYIASVNDMFRPLYRPSSGCIFPYFKVNCTIYNVFVNEISCTSIKSAFKNNYSSSRVKSYSEIKYINCIKIGCVISGEGGLWCQNGYIPVRQQWFSVVSR